MERNLDRRIEVVFPVYDSDLQKEISDLLSIQFVDKRKIRILDDSLQNRYLESAEVKNPTAQEKIYQYYIDKG